MKLLTITLFLTIPLLNCLGQATSKQGYKEFYYPQVGWKIEVPLDIKLMDSTQVEAMNNTGAKAIENTYDTTLDFSATKTLISFTKGQYNYFTSIITPFDPKEHGDWNEVNSALKYVIVETIQMQAPQLKIDTSSGVEQIDGLEFQKFHLVTTYPDKMVMNTFMYSRFHNGFDYGINIGYVDDKIGNELLSILLLSTFGK